MLTARNKTKKQNGSNTIITFELPPQPRENYYKKNFGFDPKIGDIVMIDSLTAFCETIQEICRQCKINIFVDMIFQNAFLILTEEEVVKIKLI
jgi:hypothetical protein